MGLFTTPSSVWSFDELARPAAGRKRHVGEARGLYRAGWTVPGLGFLRLDIPGGVSSRPPAVSGVKLWRVKLWYPPNGDDW